MLFFIYKLRKYSAFIEMLKIFNIRKILLKKYVDFHYLGLLIYAHGMSRRRGLSYEQKLIAALEKLPSPLEDKKHNIKIYFEDNRARSNQSRFEHIVDQRHGLRPSDIEKIPRYLKKCIFRRDPERSGTYNIYLKRRSVREEYIKISVKIDSRSPNVAIVKTMYVTTIVK